HSAQVSINTRANLDPDVNDNIWKRIGHTLPIMSCIQLGRYLLSDKINVSRTKKKKFRTLALPSLHYCTNTLIWLYLSRVRLGMVNPYCNRSYALIIIAIHLSKFPFQFPELRH